MYASTLTTLHPGLCFHGRYSVARCLKAGNMGAVYEVLDQKTRTRRALKVMHPNLLENKEMRSRFVQEAHITGPIESDHIVRVSDAGIDEETGTPFLVMEFLQGEELGSLLRKQGALPPREVVHYLYQAALGLDRTHDAGIVHRDLKPDNLFVSERDDGSPCIKILDFGIAKVVEGEGAGATRTMTLGTPLYMAPEQVMGDGAIGPAADVYALGHMAFTMLTGQSYWADEAAGKEALFPLLTKVVAGIVELPSRRAERRGAPALSPAFDAWFVKVTATRPEQRIDRPTIAIAALAGALGVPLPKAVLPVSTPPPPPSSTGFVEFTSLASRSTPWLSTDPGSSTVPDVRSVRTAALGTFSAGEPSRFRGRKALSWGTGLISLALMGTVALSVGTRRGDASGAVEAVPFGSTRRADVAVSHSARIPSPPSPAEAASAPMTNTPASLPAASEVSVLPAPPQLLPVKEPEPPVARPPAPAPKPPPVSKTPPEKAKQPPHGTLD